MAKIIIMNVGIDKTFLKFTFSQELLIMVKNADSKNKRGRLMKNMKSSNSGLMIGSNCGTYYIAGIQLRIQSSLDTSGPCIP